MSAAVAAWHDAAHGAALIAVDPAGLGGMVLRAGAGPVRDRLLERLHALLPDGTPLRKLPLHANESRLLGGLDLAATLSAGKPVHERGLLGEAHGGLVIVAMAERMERGAAAIIAAAIDEGEVRLERDGIAMRVPARIGAIVLDEGAGDDPRPPTVLLDRLAFQASLDGVALADAVGDDVAASDIAAARAGLASVVVSDAMVESLAGAALALGVDSMRATLLAVRAARAAAALAGRTVANDDDAAVAARLVLAPRATRLPAPPDDAEQEPPPPEPPQQDAADDAQQQSQQEPDRPLDDVVLEAALASMPPDLLARLQSMDLRRRARSVARTCGAGCSAARGADVRPGRGAANCGPACASRWWKRCVPPRHGSRCAARRRRMHSARVHVRRDDFRIARYRSRTRTAVIFAVDASGSAALHRLAEAKGAVELVLAECYVRRDEVALIAFRGTAAEVMLPPTRSLARAKRTLAGLPGGGGTPLASGIDAARVAR